MRAKADLRFRLGSHSQWQVKSARRLVVDELDKRLCPGRVGHCGTLSGIMEQAFSFVCILASIRNVVRRLRPEITFVGCPSLSAIQSVRQMVKQLR